MASVGNGSGRYKKAPKSVVSSILKKENARTKPTKTKKKSK